MSLVTDTLSRLEAMRDRADFQHEKRVGSIACGLAHIMGFDDDHAAAIRRAALLHDIGKLVLPDAVLHKASVLSQAENEMIKLHTTIGHELLNNESHDELKLAATIALNHHEHADGTGYPNRRLAKDVPIEARIVALSDVYSALRESRPYKLAMSHEQAINIIVGGKRRVKPVHFDADVLRALLDSPKEISAIYSEA